MDGERIVIKGVGDITKEVMAVLQRRRALAVLEAAKRLDLAAKAGRERYHIEDKSGGGYVAFQIDPVIYHAFGQRWGYAAWRDKDFIRDTLKRIPQARVVSRSRKPKVGWRAGVSREGDEGSEGARRGKGAGEKGSRGEEQRNLVANDGGLAGATAVATGRFRKTY